MAGTEKHSSPCIEYQRKMQHVTIYLSKKPCYSNYGGSQRPSHGGFFKTHGRPYSSVPGGPHMSHSRDSHVNHKVASYILHHRGLNTLRHVGHSNLSIKKNTLNESHGRDNNHMKTSGVHGFMKDNGKFIRNEKETMQLLNDRLSSYLGEIRSLEQGNAKLKKMISEWQKNDSSIMPRDHSKYSREIQELQNQISSIITENNGAVLQIDKSITALDDFNIKCEMEHSLRSNIEADVMALRCIWKESKEETGKLESEVEGLEQELLRMKRDSEQEINSLTTQLGPRVSVEVEAAQSEDLTRALFDTREQYENLIDRNQREAESLFTQMDKEPNHVVVTASEELQSVQSEIIDLWSSIHIMEIEMQSEQNRISVLRDILAEKQAYYSSELIHMQTAINIVEDQLQKIRSQSLRDTNQLLSKHNMQLVINTYQQLLDDHGKHIVEPPPESKVNGHTHNEGEEHQDG